MRTARSWLLVASAVLTACGGRPDSWDKRLDLPVRSVGLKDSVAIVDPGLDRILLLTASGMSLETHSVTVGKNVVASRASADGNTLFVLSNGVQPRRNLDDEMPSLSILDASFAPKQRVRFPLGDPLDGLAIDPKGEWVVAYDASGVVMNKNEFMLVRADGASSQPFSKTIRSFGKSPERLSFTDQLAMPAGAARRFLVVESGNYVTLIDLSDPTRDEITIPLPKTASGTDGQVAEVVSHDGDKTLTDDARLAIRIANDSNVLVVDFAEPAPGSGKDFQISPNLSDVGGIPSSVEFVQTDGGLRLAAIVPSKRGATLIDPATSLAQNVDFPKPYSKIRRITADVSTTSGASDVALLYSEQNTGIAFWALGQTTGTPFRSVDAYDIAISVRAVHDVPLGNTHLKILEANNSAEFYILDLDKRQSFPMLTDAAGFEFSIASDGLRAWAFRPGSKGFASITFSNLHPTSLTAERDVLAVYDIGRRDGGRAAIALHVIEDVASAHTALGATLLDATQPDTAESRFYGGLIFGDLP